MKDIRAAAGPVAFSGAGDHDGAFESGRGRGGRAEFHRASNAAKLLQLSQAALDVLSESENSLLTQSGAVGRVLAELQRVDAGAANLAELHGQAARRCGNCNRHLTLRGQGGRGSGAPGGTGRAVEPAADLETQIRRDLGGGHGFR